MTSLVTLYGYVGCFDTLKDEIEIFSLVGVHVLLCSCDRCEVDEFFFGHFFVFWSRWPMVVARYLSRYLVTNDAINPGHDLEKPVFDSADTCRRDSTERGGV